MSLVIMSCSDDVVDDSGIGGTENLPDTKITIIATAGGEALDTTEVTKTKDDVTYVPAGYNVSSSYTGAANLFSFMVSDLASGQNNFSASLSMSLSSYEKGTYGFTPGGISNATYKNTKISDMSYMAQGGSISITDIKEISSNGVGAYYSTGSYEINYTNESATPSLITVNVTFEGVPVAFQNISAGFEQ